MQDGDCRKLTQFALMDLEDDPADNFYGFTAEVVSLEAKVFFLQRENFQNYFKFMDFEVSRAELEKRMVLLKRQVKVITKVGREHLESNAARLRPINKEI